MYRGVRIAAVVPAYKEENHIARVIETMPDFVDDIVIVDDCSPDDTSGAARRADDGRVTLIRHEVNQGVGGAVLTAHKAAMELGADINVVMAGDAQMDPDYLPQLLDPVVDGYGFAKANRFFSGESFAGMPGYRIFGNIVLSFMTKLASGYWHIFDPQNGYTAIRTEVLRRLPMNKVAARYSFENDLLIHLNILDVPIVDVPIPAVYGNEVSSIKLRKVIPELLAMLFGGFWRRVWWKYMVWSFSAVALLLIAGIALIVMGLVAGIWVLAASVGSPTAGSVMLAVVPFVLGVQMLLVSLQLDIQASPNRPSMPPMTDRTYRAGLENTTGEPGRITRPGSPFCAPRSARGGR
ncbi:glycosyltransferase family 2 protein [Paenarthrobacter ilicis]|uniref:glycosyltransferase family 2 protein n=1 Tax=Paenarthrobacter ilicis TaxID=43665 RepID=UPI0028D306A1|nr:glycosyltransferase family 2 protein [Paenarthrobacter ilicis]